MSIHNDLLIEYEDQFNQCKFNDFYNLFDKRIHDKDYLIKQVLIKIRYLYDFERLTLKEMETLKYYIPLCDNSDLIRYLLDIKNNFLSATYI